MRYLVIEFLAVFMLIFFLTLANIIIEKRETFNVNNSITTGFIVFIFSVLAQGNSQGHFNPVFSIAQNLRGKLSSGKTIGYIGAHIIAALTAISLISIILPYSEYFNQPGMSMGIKHLKEDTDFMSVLTVELVGTMFLYLGYLYFTEKMRKNDNRYFGALYYGALAAALCIATYDLTGGAFNLASLIGGVIFDSVLDVKYVGLFIGS